MKCLNCKEAECLENQAFCAPCMDIVYVTICPVCGRSIPKDQKTILTSWDGIPGGIETHVDCAAKCGAWRQKTENPKHTA